MKPTCDCIKNKVRKMEDKSMDARECVSIDICDIATLAYGTFSYALPDGTHENEHLEIFKQICFCPACGKEYKEESCLDCDGACDTTGECKHGGEDE